MKHFRDLKYAVALVDLRYSLDVKGFYRHVTESDPYWKWGDKFGECYTTLYWWNVLDSRNNWPWDNYLMGWTSIRYAWQERVSLGRGKRNQFWNELNWGWLEVKREKEKTY